MNFRELAENLDIEEELYLEIVELFMETGRADLEKVRSAVEEGNAKEAANAAHSLKGAAGSLDLMELCDGAKAIEEKARDDRLEGILETTQELMKMLEDIAEAVRQH